MLAAARARICSREYFCARFSFVLQSRFNEAHFFTQITKMSFFYDIIKDMMNGFFHLTCTWLSHTRMCVCMCVWAKLVLILTSVESQRWVLWAGLRSYPLHVLCNKPGSSDFELPRAYHHHILLHEIQDLQLCLMVSRVHLTLLAVHVMFLASTELEVVFLMKFGADFSAGYCHSETKVCPRGVSQWRYTTSYAIEACGWKTWFQDDVKWYLLYGSERVAWWIAHLATGTRSISLIPYELIVGLPGYNVGFYGYDELCVPTVTLRYSATICPKKEWPFHSFHLQSKNS